MDMKGKMAAILLASVMLCSCSEAEDVTSGSGNMKGIFKSMAEMTQAGIDLAALSAEKHGYGQGVQLDAENRPLGALDFNRQYGRYGARAIDENDSKTIRLTFDEGYENGFTPGILDVLKEKGVKAEFFVLDDYVRKNPGLVRRMIDEGHTVGNHSVNHYSMPDLSASECRDEIMGLHEYIKEEFGYEMTEFRPPMGEFSELSLAVAQQCGYKTVLWSYAYADWDVNDQMPPDQALDKLKTALHKGAIYLLHPVSSTNAQILADFIDYALSQGYEFV
ncbi:MAG: polysaccharide deacetylase family protein [Ruminococcus sp.]|nr:polysaccharide deacetylase family protein [Ruminococcus sp.]